MTEQRPIKVPDPQPTELSIFLNAEDELKSDLDRELNAADYEQLACPHRKRLTEDCIHCLDLEEQEDDDGFPVGCMRDGMRGFRGGAP